MVEDWNNGMIKMHLNFNFKLQILNCDKLRLEAGGWNGGRLE